MTYELWHGDCLVEMDRIADGSVDMILCDLPYGTTGCKNWDNVIPFEPMWQQYFRIAKENAAICLFGSQPFTTKLISSNIKWFKYEWIWEKNTGANFANTKFMPFKEHENILVFYRKQPTYNAQRIRRSETSLKMDPPGKGRIKKNPKTRSETHGPIRKDQTFSLDGLRAPRSVLKYNVHPWGSRQHPVQKPVPLLEYLIKTYTNEGELVLDNCMGSGSTGIACLNLKRNFIGIEKDDKYFQVASDRMAKHIVIPKQGDLAI